MKIDKEQKCLLSKARTGRVLKKIFEIQNFDFDFYLQFDMQNPLFYEIQITEETFRIDCKKCILLSKF